MSCNKIELSGILHHISELLDKREIGIEPDHGGRTRASVAMIIRPAAEDLEVLFIQRSANELDPWSGHIAFPGGKLEEGELVSQAARRETLEEIGIELGGVCCLGRLSDIVGTNLPVRVSCCVFVMDRNDFVPVLSDEVSDLFWTGLSVLRDPARHLLTEVAFDDRKMEVPAIRLPCTGKPVLWGITYRLLMQFIELVELLEHGVANVTGCDTIPESIDLNEEGEL